MGFELDWIAWITGLITAANIIVVFGMIVHGIYVRREARYGSRPTSLRAHDKPAGLSGLA